MSGSCRSGSRPVKRPAYGENISLRVRAELLDIVAVQRYQRFVAIEQDANAAVKATAADDDALLFGTARATPHTECTHLESRPYSNGRPDKRSLLWFEYRDSPRCLFVDAEKPFSDRSLICWALAIARSKMIEVAHRRTQSPKKINARQA